MLDDLLIKKDKLVNQKIKLEEQIKEIDIELNKTDKIIRKLCDHNWIIDYIDKPHGNGSTVINYCEFCYLNKF